MKEKSRNIGGGEHFSETMALFVTFHEKNTAATSVMVCLETTKGLPKCHWCWVDWSVCKPHFYYFRTIGIATLFLLRVDSVMRAGFTIVFICVW